MLSSWEKYKYSHMLHALKDRIGLVTVQLSCNNLIVVFSVSVSNIVIFIIIYYCFYYSFSVTMYWMLPRPLQ